MFFFKIFFEPRLLNRAILDEYYNLTGNEFFYWGISNLLIQEKVEILKHYDGVPLSREIELTKHVVKSKDNFYYFITNKKMLFSNYDRQDFVSDVLDNLPFVTKMNGKNNENLLKIMAKQQISVLHLAPKDVKSYVIEMLSYKMKENEHFRTFLLNYIDYLCRYLEIDRSILSTNYQRAGLLEYTIHSQKHNMDFFFEKEKEGFSLLHNLFIFLGINVVDEVTLIDFLVSKGIEYEN